MCLPALAEGKAVRQGGMAALRENSAAGASRKVADGFINRQRKQKGRG